MSFAQVKLPLNYSKIQKNETQQFTQTNKITI